MRKQSIVLGSVLTLAICLLACLAASTMIGVVQGIALRPLAEHLGTTSSKGAIEYYVSQSLNEHIGADRATVHQMLDSLGSFSYRADGVSQDGGTRESAYMTLADLTIVKIWAVWILRYDTDDRLISVEMGES